ncbi:hypothetical protein [Sphingobium subterraneum]|uniref:DUF1543 domain-containing protein n=1 Tax=Sphingobium subterraneum TaxID=627688 RepID=A0A841J214_9SPHN|nr:hypothetical protein [Sphingobium subterraneum]MBB6124867.1 hypothetical protein [Sphingobium subterraneum]
MKLYLVEIGGMRDGSLFESHEVHALVAETESALVALCNARFADIMHAAHIDGWTSFAVHPRPALDAARQERLFLVELGQNAPDHVRERHDYHLITATSGKDAARSARTQAKGWHIDAVVDLDELALAMGVALQRSADGERPVPDYQSRYLRLSSKTLAARSQETDVERPPALQDAEKI